ncbi:MAG: hypothetical protein AAFX39_12705 [Pseudomonadota bacterium]
MMATLVITNGDSAADLLNAANLAGDCLIVWRDLLHEGPVIDTGDLTALSASRAAFIASDHACAIDQDQGLVRSDFTQRNAAFRRHHAFDTIELWVEHDLYDQLQLLQILTLLDRDGRHHGVTLVQAPDYLGLQTPETIGRFKALSRPLGAHDFATARRHWEAFAAGTPASLLLAVDETRSDAFPFLGQAMLRLLAELPDTRTGLRETERLALTCLRDHGPLNAGPLFKLYCDVEAAMFHGDASFFSRLDGLKLGPAPLISGPTGCYADVTRDETGKPSGPYLTTAFEITETGRRVLDGQADATMLNGADCWFGATHITSESVWRWDAKARQVIPPKP